MNVSQLTRYSIGIAAENKPLNSRELNATPVESLSALDGEINFNPTETTVVGTDTDGSRYEVTTTQDVTLTCEWLPLASNRVTPPDIRRGELVEIYRLADTDQYFWRCMGLRDHLRRLETAIYAFNASPNQNSPGLDPETCYFLEISAHRKVVTFSTSKANGEPYGYSFQVNTGEGNFVFEDDIGNNIYVNSGESLVELLNSSDTVLQLSKENIYGKANRDIRLQCKDFTLTAGNNIAVEAGANIDIGAGSAYALKAGNSIYQEAPTFNVKTDKYETDSPTSTFTGALEVGQDLKVGGGISMGTGGGGSARAEINGNVDVEGEMEVTGTIRCNRIEANSTNFQ